jgi:hypothetical protein
MQHARRTIEVESRPNGHAGRLALHSRQTSFGWSRTGGARVVRPHQGS